MTAVGAALPLLAVLGLMLWRRWSSGRAGAVGYLLAMLVGWGGFGLTWPVLWVSQTRALMLALFILYIIWPALLLYHMVRSVGGVARVEEWISGRVGDRAAAGLILAWALSSLLEGIAGFGVPLAVVSPMLAALGFPAVTAVAAVAIGHAWSVTFGDMGVVFEALASVVRLDGAVLAPAAVVQLGLACVASGLGVALLLGLRRWGRVLTLGLAMATVHGLLAIAGLRPLASLAAGAVGVVLGVRLFRDRPSAAAAGGGDMALRLFPYLATSALLAAIAFSPDIAGLLARPETRVALPEVVTARGWVTAAGQARSISWLSHPGSVMLFSLALFLPLYRRLSPPGRDGLRGMMRSLLRMLLPVTLGVTVMIGLAMVMDHSGMTQTLARSAAAIVGGLYPALSGFVGLLGAFTTGSNTSSNVLFGPLQMEMARTLSLPAEWLLAAQTAGGALGSMVAPAKLVLGCAVLGIEGEVGAVLRRTLPWALGLALVAGVLAWALT